MTPPADKLEIIRDADGGASVQALLTDKQRRWLAEKRANRAQKFLRRAEAAARLVHHPPESLPGARHVVAQIHVGGALTLTCERCGAERTVPGRVREGHKTRIAFDFCREHMLCAPTPQR